MKRLEVPCMILCAGILAVIVMMSGCAEDDIPLFHVYSNCPEGRVGTEHTIPAPPAQLEIEVCDNDCYILIDTVSSAKEYRWQFIPDDGTNTRYHTMRPTRSNTIWFNYPGDLDRTGRLIISIYNSSGRRIGQLRIRLVDC